MNNDKNEMAEHWLQLFRQAGAITQGLVLGFLVVLAAIELASLAGHLSPFKYQGF